MDLPIRWLPSSFYELVTGFTRFKYISRHLLPFLLLPLQKLLRLYFSNCVTWGLISVSVTFCVFSNQSYATNALSFKDSNRSAGKWFTYALIPGCPAG